MKESIYTLGLREAGASTDEALYSSGFVTGERTISGEIARIRSNMELQVCSAVARTELGYDLKLRRRAVSGDDIELSDDDINDLRDITLAVMFMQTPSYCDWVKKRVHETTRDLDLSVIERRMERVVRALEEKDFETAASIKLSYWSCTDQSFELLREFYGVSGNTVMELGLAAGKRLAEESSQFKNQMIEDISTSILDHWRPSRSVNFLADPNDVGDGDKGYKLFSIAIRDDSGEDADLGKIDCFVARENSWG